MKFLLIIILFLTSLAHAKPQAVYPFDDVKQQQRFDNLSRELRCMVCQNQNLADSNAELALMMRAKVYQMVREGQSEQAIKTYMQSRYGDFILLKPPSSSKTTVLWLLPSIFLLLGVTLLLIKVRRQREAV